MSLPILISNRFIKLLGNTSKMLCYPFHWLFPHKRFTIAEYSPAKIHPTNIHKIPKILWQTNYTNHVSLPVYLNYLFNRLMSLDYEYRYVGDSAILDYLEKNSSPKLLSAYKKLTNGAAKADLWRLVVLYNEGGVYLDMDAHFIWPLSKIIKPEYDELFVTTKKHLSNYFLATAKGNQVIKDTIDIIINNIEENKGEMSVYSLTGPGALHLGIGDKKVNHKLYRYICVQGSFTNEHFHYIDKRMGKWIHAKPNELVKKEV